MTIIGKRALVIAGLAVLAVAAGARAVSASTVCDLRTALPTGSTCGIGGGGVADRGQHPPRRRDHCFVLPRLANRDQRGSNTDAGPGPCCEETGPRYTS